MGVLHLPDDDNLRFGIAHLAFKRLDNRFYYDISRLLVKISGEEVLDRKSMSVIFVHLKKAPRSCTRPTTTR